MRQSAHRTMSKIFTATALCIGLLSSAAAFSTPVSAEINVRPYGDVKVLATVPSPVALPEGIAVKGNKVYVSGPATFGNAGNGHPSEVYVFDIKSGELVERYPVQGENLALDHANSNIAFDGNGRLYVNNIQLGIYRLNLDNGQQEIYSSPLPNLPQCSVVQPAPCAPTVIDSQTPLPNDIIFDAAGNAYVTDSMQATIWRIPAGGGAPQIWFQDARFASPYVGVNGMRLDPTGTKMYLTVSIDMTGQGWIYTLPLVAQPTAADLQPFFHFPANDLPDGIAFGSSGLIYVAIATPFNSGITVIDTNGNQVARLANPIGSPIFPYDSPASIAFNKHGSLLTINHAFATMIPSHFTVLDVFVGDKELPLIKPLLP
ncbi:MAG TPA: SMP-30/gluconolactonase/LRE family protein [Pyrinomonadaceae bacterium]